MSIPEFLQPPIALLGYAIIAAIVCPILGRAIGGKEWIQESDGPSKVIIIIGTLLWPFAITGMFITPILYLSFKYSHEFTNYIVYLWEHRNDTDELDPEFHNIEAKK